MHQNGNPNQSEMARMLLNENVHSISSPCSRYECEKFEKNEGVLAEF